MKYKISNKDNIHKRVKHCTSPKIYDRKLILIFDFGIAADLIEMQYALGKAHI